jgi:hypothetical protein
MQVRTSVNAFGGWQTFIDWVVQLIIFVFLIVVERPSLCAKLHWLKLGVGEQTRHCGYCAQQLLLAFQIISTLMHALFDWMQAPDWAVRGPIFLCVAQRISSRILIVLVRLVSDALELINWLRDVKSLLDHWKECETVMIFSHFFAINQNWRCYQV